MKTLPRCATSLETAPSQCLGLNDCFKSQCVQGCINAEAQQQLTGDAAEVMQCMANAVAKASELEMATEQLRAASQAASHMQPPSLPHASYHHHQHHHPSSSHPPSLPCPTPNGYHPAHSPTAAALAAVAGRQVPLTMPAASSSSSAYAGAPNADERQLAIDTEDGFQSYSAITSQPAIHVVQPTGVATDAAFHPQSSQSPQQTGGSHQTPSPLHQHQHSSSLSDLGENEVAPSLLWATCICMRDRRPGA